MKIVLISTVAFCALGIGALLVSAPTADGQSQTAATVIPALSVDVENGVKYPTELVELFTSQGCSSCPPADRFVASLADSPTTLALSFNVTYWDYLGWKDRFGQREFTSRQKDYAKTLGIGNVYTPQIVLNGATHSNRFTRSQVMSVALSDDRPIINLAVDDTSLWVLPLENLDLNDFDLTLISYQPGLQSTPVKRGENRSRTLKNYNVVTGVHPLTSDTDYTFDRSNEQDGLAYAVLAADPTTAEVLSITQISTQ